VKEIIVIRLSSIGDVSLCLPVVQRILALDKKIHITFITKSETAFIFQNIDRLRVIEAHVNSKHNGILGLWKLSKLIRSQSKKIYAIVDLHNVIRSRILTFFLKFHATKFAVITKNRTAKKQILSSANSAIAGIQDLPHITTIYSNAFAKIGIDVDSRFVFPAIVSSKEDLEKATQYFLKNGASYNIAMAPFAKHDGKILPWTTVLEILEDLNQKEIKVFMYGGTGIELQQMQLAANTFKNVILLDHLSFAQQIAFLNYMQCAVTMDSANMHFASLQGVPLVSVWGATHTQLGFGALNINTTVIEIPKTALPCRPCSVYGNKICHLQREPYACLARIQSTTILSAIYTKLGL
jgi:ADP-heptose:LPS heptosyltransferase